MVVEQVTLDELLDVRERLIKILLTSLTEDERNFLLLLKQGKPDYSLLPFQNLEQLPALKWKLINVKKMDKKKHIMMINKLRSVLGV